MADNFDFCVVGAGRMGASIAGHLVLQGARVALFDRSDYDRYAVACACIHIFARTALSWLSEAFDHPRWNEHGYTYTPPQITPSISHDDESEGKKDTRSCVQT